MPFSFHSAEFKSWAGAKENGLDNKTEKENDMTQNVQVRKCYETIPVASDDIDRKAIDTHLKTIPIKVSRSRFCRSLIRFGLEMLRQKKVTYQQLDSEDYESLCAPLN